MATTLKNYPLITKIKDSSSYFREKLPSSLMSLGLFSAEGDVEINKQKYQLILILILNWSNQSRFDFK